MTAVTRAALLGLVVVALVLVVLAALTCARQPYPCPDRHAPGVQPAEGSLCSLPTLGDLRGDP